MVKYLCHIKDLNSVIIIANTIWLLPLSRLVVRLCMCGKNWSPNLLWGAYLFADTRRSFFPLVWSSSNVKQHGRNYCKNYIPGCLYRCSGCHHHRQWSANWFRSNQPTADMESKLIRTTAYHSRTNSLVGTLKSKSHKLTYIHTILRSCTQLFGVRFSQITCVAATITWTF